VRSIKRIIQGPTPVEVKSEYFLVPHTVSRHFTGRHEMLQIMKDKLVPNRIVKDQQRFVLYGLGGSGKTQMSLKFAQDHEEK
jgi:signal recognition particle GTPase